MEKLVQHQLSEVKKKGNLNNRNKKKTVSCFYETKNISIPVGELEWGKLETDTKDFVLENIFIEFIGISHM
jgi:hypothetical protein